MSHEGCVQVIFVFVAPPDQVEEGKRIFRSHAKWMEKTHHKGGEKALLSYNLSTGPHPADMADPDSPPTGKTCFILNEIYETQVGVDDHFQQSEESWEDLPALMDWMEKCEVAGAPSAHIHHSLW